MAVDLTSWIELHSQGPVTVQWNLSGAIATALRSKARAAGTATDDRT